MKLIKCQQCGYEWESRVAIPKQCPRCKRYDYIAQVGGGYTPEDKDYCANSSRNESESSGDLSLKEKKERGDKDGRTNRTD